MEWLRVRARILVQVTIYRRLRIGRDGPITCYRGYYLNGSLFYNTVYYFSVCSVGLISEAGVYKSSS